MAQASVPTTRRSRTQQLLTVVVAAVTAAVVSVVFLVLLESDPAPATPAGELAPASDGAGGWSDGRVGEDAWEDYPGRLGG